MKRIYEKLERKLCELSVTHESYIALTAQMFLIDFRNFGFRFHYFTWVPFWLHSAWRRGWKY